jgi:ribose transport system permease protein
MRARVMRILRAYSFLFALVLAVGLFIGNLIALPAFVSVANWDTNLTTFAPFAILAVASTPAIMTGGGGLDLSIAPSANLANVVLVVELLTNPNLQSPWVSIPIVLALTTAIGVFNGLVVTLLRVPPVVTTVGMLLILLGLNQRIAPLPTSVTAGWVESLHGDLGPVPWGLILIAIPLVLWSLTRLTPFYDTLYLVGGNAPTAYSAGVNVNAVKIAAYGIGGFFAGIGGLAITAVFLTSDPNIGFEYSLIAMAAVALGGTPIGMGGRGGVLGSMLGAAVIYLLQNLILVSHISNSWLQVVYGMLLIVGTILGGLVAVPLRPPRAKAGGAGAAGVSPGKAATA